MDVNVGLAYEEGVTNTVSNIIRRTIDVPHYAERGNTEGRFTSAIFYSAASASVDEAFKIAVERGLKISKIPAEERAASEDPNIARAEVAYRIGK